MRTGRGCLAFGLAAAAGCGAVTAPDGVRAGANPTVIVAGLGPRFVETALAVAPQGRAIALWSHDRGVMTSESDDGVRWTPERRIHEGQPRDAYDLAIELDGHGDGFAAWIESRDRETTVVACRYRAASGWDAPEDVAHGRVAGFNRLTLAVAPDGDALLAWGDPDGVFSSSWSGSMWGAPQRLADAVPYLDLGEIQARVKDGAAAVCWNRYRLFVEEFPSYSTIGARVRDTTGAWSEAVELARTPRPSAFIGRPVLGPEGSATFLWGTRRSAAFVWTMQAARRDAWTGWQASEALGDANSIAGFEPAEGGASTAFLESHADVSAGTLAVLRLAPSLAWQGLAAIDVRPASVGSTSALSAVAPGGARVAFVGRDGALRIAAVAGSGTPERPPDVAGEENACPAAGPQLWGLKLGVDASGTATLLWTRRDCQSFTLRAWRTPAPKP